MTIIINREWAMPNKHTFSIKPISKLLHKYMSPEIISIDPFANTSRFATITNDLDPACGCDYTLEAFDFLRLFKDNSVDCVLFDPPYSPRQVSESYKRLKGSVSMTDTQASFWSKLKKEIARIVDKDGVVISASWNTNGIGKTLGFELTEILLVAHGGWHNDTIVIVEHKL